MASKPRADGSNRTWTGRVVYDRPRHAFSWRDARRIIASLPLPDSTVSRRKSDDYLYIKYIKRLCDNLLVENQIDQLVKSTHESTIRITITKTARALYSKFLSIIAPQLTTTKEYPDPVSPGKWYTVKNVPIPFAGDITNFFNNLFTGILDISLTAALGITEKEWERIKEH